MSRHSVKPHILGLPRFGLLLPAIFMLSLLTACGGGGGGGGGGGSDEGGINRGPPPPPQVSITATPTTINEGSTSRITISRTGSTSSAVDVPFTVSGSNIDPIDDYSGIPSSPLTIAAGSASAGFTITATLDSAIETTDETLTITLTAPTGYILGTSRSTQITITDAGGGGGSITPIRVTFAQAAYSAAEDDVAEVIIKLQNSAGMPASVPSDGSPLSVQIDITPNGGAIDAGLPNADYRIRTGTPNPVLFMAGGSSEKILRLENVQDGNIEIGESLTLTLPPSLPNGYIFGNITTATVTLEDNDKTLGLSSNRTTITEGGSDAAMVTLRLGGNLLTGSITAKLQITSATATLNDDYTVSGDGMLVGTEYLFTFTAGGALTKTLTITPGADDGMTETETLSVTISDSPSGYTESGSPSIAINDPGPEISITATPTSINEGSSSTITIRRTGSTSNAVAVPFTVTRGSNIVPNDYSGIPSSPLTIADGSASAQFTITANTDNVDELNETLTIIPTAPAGYALAGVNQVGVTIMDRSSGTGTGPACVDLAGVLYRSGSVCIIEGNDDLVEFIGDDLKYQGTTTDWRLGETRTIIISTPPNPTNGRYSSITFTGVRHGIPFWEITGTTP